MLRYCSGFDAIEKKVKRNVGIHFRAYYVDRVEPFFVFIFTLPLFYKVHLLVNAYVMLIGIETRCSGAISREIR